LERDSQKTRIPKQLAPQLWEQLTKLEKMVEHRKTRLSRGTLEEPRQQC